jgi:hypothetical protein
MSGGVGDQFARAQPAVPGDLFLPSHRQGESKTSSAARIIFCPDSYSVSFAGRVALLPREERREGWPAKHAKKRQRKKGKECLVNLVRWQRRTSRKQLSSKQFPSRTTRLDYQKMTTSFSEPPNFFALFRVFRGQSFSSSLGPFRGLRPLLYIPLAFIIFGPARTIGI